jgi:hypothetical protein
MAKIVDPDSLNQGVEVVLDTANKTIQLLEAGNLSDASPGAESGVTGQALYSFLKEEWRTDSDLNVFKFPMKMIYEAKFEYQFDWIPADAQSIDLLRDAGFKVSKNGSYAEYLVAVSLGSFDASTDAAYYQQAQGFDQATATLDKTGAINEPILIADSDTTYYDYIRFFLREQGKLFDEYDLVNEQNITALSYVAYKFPLSNADDINYTTIDSDIVADSDLADMTIDYYRGNLFATWSGATAYASDDVVNHDDTDAGVRWYRRTAGGTTSDDPSTDATNWEAYPGERQVGASYFAYNRAIDFKTILSSNAYEWVQYQLRQDTDINANTDTYGVVNGNVAMDMLYWVGNTLTTQPGVFVDNHNSNNQNNLDLYDITVDGGGLDTDGVGLVSTKRQYPFVAAGNMVFSTNLVADTDSVYWMYFEEVTDGSYNTSDAILVQDQSSSDITGFIDAASIAFTFDYDNNVQGGRSATSDAVVWVAAMGKAGAEWIDATFTISRATGLSFPVNAADERNYSNP